MGFLSKLRGILLLVALLVGGPVMLFAGWKESKDSQALADHGVVTDALVTEVTWSTKRGRERNFHAKVTFVTADNREVHDDVSVSDVLGKQLRDAPDDKPTTISVRYLPEDTTTVALADHRDESAFFYGVGAILLLIGIGILVYRLRRPAAEPVAA
ncbi:MAG TPA: DUF3592 domain-containing protein [Tahibacter sp.]|uniref:DUF3592 domain-containing protein n=1 Tax=Tahibacter sp. TaxID=2056211 RepID=UPI002C42A39E|nr:DUF3592 domain-containing protein [Tahibacter sp.]HSX62219.1 DUF3592 domain-containing protein [Tahibacter sp.]